MRVKENAFLKPKHFCITRKHCIKVEVWRVEGSKRVAVDKKDYGKFYAGDCYIVLYTYRPRGREEYIIYYWQGLESTKDEVMVITVVTRSVNDLGPNWLSLNKVIRV